MTTDITELAQSLKAAAEKATPGPWRRSSVRFNGITDIANPMEQGSKPHVANASEKRDAEFIALANPSNILALVEALEKAQQYAKERDAENQDLMLTVGRLRVEREGLESRTVKLPPKIERVDADVSDRNQPGMVVAVHIDAGDFVKFRDQVYEVKETDFDDHDVTLWFVCGEVLKCAAGCQIEVVSAPVEDE